MKQQGLQSRTKFIQRWEDSVIAQGAIGIVQRADAEDGIRAKRTKPREWQQNLTDAAKALGELMDGARSMWTQAKSLLEQVKGYALNVDQEKYMERQQRRIEAENRKADVNLAEIRRRFSPPDAALDGGDRDVTD